MHRDLGYLAVGLTVVYALSGLAVNHIADWDPNFVDYERTHELGGPLVAASDDGDRQRTSRRQLGVDGRTARGVPRGDELLDVLFDKRTLHVNHDERPRGRRGAEAALLPPHRQLAAPEPRQEGVDLHRRRLRRRPPLPGAAASS